MLDKQKKEVLSLVDHPEEICILVEDEVQRKRGSAKEALLNRMFGLMEKIELEKTSPLQISC